MMFYRKKKIIMAVGLVLFGLSTTVFSQVVNERTLMLQQTPSAGGMVSPEVGIHSFEVNSEVVLHAIANPGYQFVYWMGDVSDPTSSRTKTYLDSPKIIIAVFERIGYESLLMAEAISSLPRPRLVAKGADYARGGYAGGGRKRPHKRRLPTWEEPEFDDLPVPEDGPPDDDLPVPIPEPATLILLGLGGLLAVKRGGKNRYYE